MSNSGADQELLEDRLFLVDASRSMGWKLQGSKERKLDIVKQGLIAFCSKLWPVSYYDKPTRLGIVALRYLGVPSRADFEVIVPLYPSPMSLELYRLQKLDAKGGCQISDGLKYSTIILRESDRPAKRVDLITDGDSQGPDPLPYARTLRELGIKLNLVELATKSTMPMMEVVSQSGGKYWLVRDPYELEQALA